MTNAVPERQILLQTPHPHYQTRITDQAGVDALTNLFSAAEFVKVSKHHPAQIHNQSPVHLDCLKEREFEAASHASSQGSHPGTQHVDGAKLDQTPHSGGGGLGSEGDGHVHLHSGHDAAMPDDKANPGASADRVRDLEAKLAAAEACLLYTSPSPRDS